MTQQELILPPASHKNDPDTSKQAEKKAPIKGQALIVLNNLRSYQPCTMFELASWARLDYYMLQKRISVLEKNNLAVRDGTKKNPATNNQCQIWKAVY